MDKRTWKDWIRKQYPKDMLAMVIGALMVYAEVLLIGLFAAYYTPSDSYKASLSAWNAHLVPIGLTLAICAAPCMLAAFFVSLIRPQRWMHYGYYAMIITLVETLRSWWGATNLDIPFSNYAIFNQTANLLLFPFFLWLFYLSSRATLRTQTQA